MMYINFIPFLKSSRPEQWLKNIFVLGPISFSMNFLNSEKLIEVFIAFICFVLASSVTYILNDLHDIQEDKFHPKKKLRPIPAGLISKNEAIIFSSILIFVLYLLLYNFLNNYCLMIITAYLILQVFYTLKAKYIVILDVTLIASGFVLRIILGGYAIDVNVSNWMIISTFFLTIFLAFGKRYNEYNFEQYIKIRHSKSQYDVKLLKDFIIISCVCTIIMYGLFLVDTAERIQNQNLIYTLVFVIFGMFRYLQFLFVYKKGGEPEIIFFHDLPILINTFLWGLSTIWIMYK